MPTKHPPLAPRAPTREEAFDAFCIVIAYAAVAQLPPLGRNEDAPELVGRHAQMKRQQGHILFEFVQGVARRMVAPLDLDDDVMTELIASEDVDSAARAIGSRHRVLRANDDEIRLENAEIARESVADSVFVRGHRQSREADAEGKRAALDCRARALAWQPRESIRFKSPRPGLVGMPDETPPPRMADGGLASVVALTRFKWARYGLASMTESPHDATGPSADLASVAPYPDPRSGELGIFPHATAAHPSAKLSPKDFPASLRRHGAPRICAEGHDESVVDLAWRTPNERTR